MLPSGTSVSSLWSTNVADFVQNDEADHLSLVILFICGKVMMSILLPPHLFKLIKMYYWHQNLMKNQNQTSLSVPHSKWKHYWEVMTSCSCFPLCSIAKHFCRSLQRSLKNGLRLAPVLSVMRDGKFKHIAFKSNQDLSFFTKTLLPGNGNKPGKVCECIWWEY